MIDTSAVLAVLLREPEARLFAERIEADPVRLISAVTWLETHMVMSGRLGSPGGLLADSFLREVSAEVVPFDSDQMATARVAWARFGKGRHAAALNLGDCCAYAAAMNLDEPLLYKGNDFGQTDVQSVL